MCEQNIKNNKMLKSTWAYSLKREDLVSYLNEFEISSTGNVEELRKRFAKFLVIEHDPVRLQRLCELQSKHDVSNTPKITLPLPPEGSSHQSTSPVKSENEHQQKDSLVATEPKPVPSEPKVAVIDQVRKWGLKYDGGRDPLGFIDRVEELSEMYGVHLDQLPQIMPEFFREKALTWFRNNNKHWQVWKLFKHDFCVFFLPPRYFERLEDEIRKRVQRPRERFKDYLLSLQNLMRHSNLTEDQKLDRIFHNSHPDYQMYIRRKDFSSLSDLIELADELESIPTNSQQHRGENHRMLTGPINSNNNYNNNNYNNIFCVECGHQGVRTEDCCLRSAGNAVGGRQY